MDKLKTTIILFLLLFILIAIAAFCNTRMIKEEAEPIQTLREIRYKVIPVAALYEDNNAADKTDAAMETGAPTVEGKSMTVTAYAYCPCLKCCGKNDGITSTGTQATAGRTIAVDPAVIQYGSTVMIDGHSYIAEDCGGTIKGNTVDVFFNTHEEALEWGVKTIEITVFSPDTAKAK